MKIDPAKLSEYSKEKLVKFYVEARDRLGVLEATRKIVSEELLTRIEGDGEAISNYSVVRCKRVSFPKIDISKARELGATKEVRDDSVLKKLLSKGVKIPHAESEYLLVKDISQEG